MVIEQDPRTSARSKAGPYLLPNVQTDDASKTGVDPPSGILSSNVSGLTPSLVFPYDAQRSQRQRLCAAGWPTWNQL